MNNEIQKKIEELEALGLFDQDIMDDPPGREIAPDEIEYINKTVWQRIKRRFAFFLAYFVKAVTEKRHLYAVV